MPCFQHYMDHDGLSVSRAEFESNLGAKLESKDFLGDIAPLIAADLAYDPLIAANLIHQELIARLPGNPWKGEPGHSFP